MTAQAQAQAPSAQAAKGSKPKPVLAAITPETAKAFASGVVGAVVLAAKAEVTLLATVQKLCAKVSVQMTADQYTRQLAPGIAKAFEAKERAGKVKDTGPTQSRIKTATLAILNGVATPLAGEGFKAFCSRASELIPGATLADGKPVWEGKKGRPAGNGGKAKGSNVTPLRGKQEPETNETAIMAAALIVTGDNRNRAQKLTAIFPAFASEFDRWAATILSDEERTTAKRRAVGGKAK